MTTHPASVPEYGVLEGAHPLLPFLGVARLEVERLVVDGDGEGAVVLVVDAYHSALQTDTTATDATHHLLFRLKRRQTKYDLRSQAPMFSMGCANMFGRK